MSGSKDQRVQTICLLILTTVAVGFSLFWLKSVMVPFSFALLISFLLDPVIRFATTRLRVQQAVAVVVALLLVFLCLASVAALVSTSVAQFDSESYSERFEVLSEKAKAWVPLKDLPQLLSTGQIGGLLKGLLSSVMRLLSQALLVLIFLFFLLMGRSMHALTEGSVWYQIDLSVKRYIAVKCLTSGFTGLLVWLILSLLKIDLALVFGVLAFFLNFIPSIGSIIASLLPLPVVILNPEVSWVVGVCAIALPSGVQFVIGNVAEPRLLGSTLGLHPVAVLFALIFWGMLWGFIGMFLAVPLTVVIKIFAEKLELTAPVADLLAGRSRTMPTTE